MLSGKYEDDFDNTITAAETGDVLVQSQSQESQDSLAATEERATESGGSFVEELSNSDSAGAKEQDTLTVSFEDIGTLRRSLERDEVIRESLASNQVTAQVYVRHCLHVWIDHCTMYICCLY